MLINNSKQIFCMDGTTAIKDTVHDLAYTMGVQPTATGYTLRARPLQQSTMPKNWTFQGSNDDINYVTLDTQTGIVFSSGETKTFSFANTTPYRYYKWVITLNNGGNYISIMEAEILVGGVDVTPQILGWADDMPNVVWASDVLAGYPARMAFDHSTTYFWCTNTAVVTSTLKFDFGTIPKTGSLMGVTAPYIGRDGYSFCGIPTVSTGMTPGMPITIVCVVNKTDAWDDGVNRVLFMCGDDYGGTWHGFEVVAYYWGWFAISLWDATGQNKWTGKAINATNWSANEDHIIVATMDEEANQRFFIDGAEGFMTGGTATTRETSLGTNTEIGVHLDGKFALDGYELCTAYSRLLDDAEIALVSSTTLWTDLIDPPVPPTHKSEKKSAYVSILDPTGSTPLARLTEHFPSTGWTPDIFENLSFESVNRGGYTVASFTIHRPVTQFWADLQYRNQVIIGRGSEIYWEGYISRPVRSIRPDAIEVACLGWSAELNQLWTSADITAPVGGYKMSTFVNAVLLVDPNTNIVAGTIETGDYSYPAGTLFAFAPNKYYSDALEELNAGNNFNWGVWGNRAIDLRAKHSSVDWLVWTGDCEDLTISPNPDALCNYVMANFTQDGTHNEQVIVQDAGVGSSQEKYDTVIMQRVDIPGKVDESSGGAGIPGGATHIAEVYLAEHKDLKVAAEFTCNRIFDSYGAEQYLGKVRGGEVVRIVDWLPTEETLGGVNDIATFEIKSPKYDHDNDTLAITPTEFLPSTDVQIARLQATGY